MFLQAIASEERAYSKAIWRLGALRKQSQRRCSGMTTRARRRPLAPASAPAAAVFTLSLQTTASEGLSLAKPNYSFEKRQREIAKQKKQEEKDARKREAREATKATNPSPDDAEPPKAQ